MISRGIYSSLKMRCVYPLVLTLCLCLCDSRWRLPPLSHWFRLWAPSSQLMWQWLRSETASCLPEDRAAQVIDVIHFTHQQHHVLDLVLTFKAEMWMACTSPPNSSQTMLWARSSCLTLWGSAWCLSHLFTAKIIGTETHTEKKENKHLKKRSRRGEWWESEDSKTVKTLRKQ